MTIRTVLFSVHLLIYITMKIYIYTIILLWWLIISLPLMILWTAHALPPSYDQNFARHLLEDKSWTARIDPFCQNMSKQITNWELELAVTLDNGARQNLQDRIGSLKQQRTEYEASKWLSNCSSKEIQTLRNLWFDKKKSLMENVRMFFYPDITGRGWFLRDFLRVVGFIVLVVMIVWTWFNIFLKSEDGAAALKEANNLIYIGLWSGILFGATWILWVALKLWNTWWTTALVANIQNNVLFQILIFLKAMAFFVAIIIIVYYWFAVIQSSDSEDKFKEARSWILNILLALVFIKIIDYIFFIAQQTNFKTRAVELIVQVSTIMMYLLWFLFVTMLLYAGIRLLTSNGDETQWKNAQNIIFNIFLITIVIFLFLLIIYQVFAEFA